MSDGKLDCPPSCQTSARIIVVWTGIIILRLIYDLSYDLSIFPFVLFRTTGGIFISQDL